jgi:hypothetical protein
MIFKNLIIKTKCEDTIELQKYLFHLGYSWYDGFSHSRHRQIKKFDNKNGVFYNEKYIYIVIAKSCDLTYKTGEAMEVISKKACDYDKYKTITYEQFTRKLKLKKLLNECNL